MDPVLAHAVVGGDLEGYAPSDRDRGDSDEDWVVRDDFHMADITLDHFRSLIDYSIWNGRPGPYVAPASGPGQTQVTGLTLVKEHATQRLHSIASFHMDLSQTLRPTQNAVAPIFNILEPEVPPLQDLQHDTPTHKRYNDGNPYAAFLIVDGSGHQPSYLDGSQPSGDPEDVL